MDDIISDFQKQSRILLCLHFTDDKTDPWRGFMLSNNILVRAGICTEDSRFLSPSLLAQVPNHPAISLSSYCLSLPVIKKTKHHVKTKN